MTDTKPMHGMDAETILAMTHRANDGNLLKTAAALAKETARLLADRAELTRRAEGAESHRDALNETLLAERKVRAELVGALRVLVARYDSPTWSSVGTDDARALLSRLGG